MSEPKKNEEEEESDKSEDKEESEKGEEEAKELGEEKQDNEDLNYEGPLTQPPEELQRETRRRISSQEGMSQLVPKKKARR